MLNKTREEFFRGEIWQLMGRYSLIRNINPGGMRYKSKDGRLQGTCQVSYRGWEKDYNSLFNWIFPQVGIRRWEKLPDLPGGQVLKGIHDYRDHPTEKIIEYNEYVKKIENDLIKFKQEKLRGDEEGNTNKTS